MGRPFCGPGQTKGNYGRSRLGPVPGAAYIEACGFSRRSPAARQVGAMKKTTIGDVALAAALAFAGPAAADSMRCGSKLMTDGDPADKVVAYCGEPASIERREILRSYGYHRGMTGPQLVRGLGRDLDVQLRAAQADVPAAVRGRAAGRRRYAVARLQLTRFLTSTGACARLAGRDPRTLAGGPGWFARSEERTLARSHPAVRTRADVPASRARRPGGSPSERVKFRRERGSPAGQARAQGVERGRRRRTEFVGASEKNVSRLRHRSLVFRRRRH